MRPGHSRHLDARDARLVADLDHESALNGMMSTTMYLISGWSLYRLLTWPIDNDGADRGEDAGEHFLCQVRAVRLCSEGDRPGSVVWHGFARRFKRKRMRGQPISTSDVAQWAWWSDRFKDIPARRPAHARHCQELTHWAPSNE